MPRSIEIRSGAGDGPGNMALDELLLRMACRGEIGFALRTYTWSPACVSLGRLQDPSREISARLLRSSGIGVVRRPTGGRSVWHESELTYCVAASPGHPLASGGITESLAVTGGILADALRSLGIPAELSRADRHALNPRMPANPCFTSHGRMEVTVRGGKVVGSAQARRRGSFLEHGSMIVRNDQTRLADYLPVVDGSVRGKVRAILSEGVRGMADLVPGLVPGALREPVHEAFSRAFGESLERVCEEDLRSVELSEIEDEFRREADSWE